MGCELHGAPCASQIGANGWRARAWTVLGFMRWHARCTCAAQEAVFEMADLIFPLVTIGFFVVAWAYVRWCDGL